MAQQKWPQALRFCRQNRLSFLLDLFASCNLQSLDIVHTFEATAISGPKASGLVPFARSAAG